MKLVFEVGSDKPHEDSIVREAGLHFRLPFFADSVTLLDTRMKIHQSPMKCLFQTSDGQQIVVKAFLLWKVEYREGTAPLEFYRAYGSADVCQKVQSIVNFEMQSTVLSAYTL